MALLEVKNLSVYFQNKVGQPAVEAVKGISYELEAGDILGIVGESGSGKSVSALSILGLLPYPKAYHGEGSSIRFKGKELLGAPDLQQVRGNKISFIFQEPMASLNPLQRIEKQISETLILHCGFSPKQARKEVLRLLKLTGIKKARQRMKAFPFELSGGQRQRVMIAMAMANNPEILIADEPTTALDVTVQKQILELLLNLQKKTGMAIIFISHDLRLVKKIANKICVMKDGRIVEAGLSKQVFENPQDDYTKRLINSFFVLKNNNKKANELSLKAQNIKVDFVLKKSFWGKVIERLQAVDDVSFVLKKGETLGIVGESGSGKTTLGLALVGLHHYQGWVSLGDEEKFVEKQKDKSFRKRVQMVFQDPYNSLNPRMNVQQIVGEGLEVHFSELKDNEKKKRIINVLEEVGLNENDMEKYPHEFSGGQRQRIAIARALVLEPEVVILDEPTSALDVTIQKQVLNLLMDIQKKRNISYIFISHDMAVIRAIADRVAVMKDGKFVELNDCDAIFSQPENEYTQKLIAAAI